MIFTHYIVIYFQLILFYGKQQIKEGYYNHFFIFNSFLTERCRFVGYFVKTKWKLVIFYKTHIGRLFDYSPFVPFSKISKFLLKNIKNLPQPTVASDGIYDRQNPRNPNSITKFGASHHIIYIICKLITIKAMTKKELEPMINFINTCYYYLTKYQIMSLFCFKFFYITWRIINY